MRAHEAKRGIVRLRIPSIYIYIYIYIYILTHCICIDTSIHSLEEVLAKCPGTIDTEVLEGVNSPGRSLQ